MNAALKSEEWVLIFAGMFLSDKVTLTQLAETDDKRLLHCKVENRFYIDGGQFLKHLQRLGRNSVSPELIELLKEVTGLDVNDYLQ